MGSCAMNISNRTPTHIAVAKNSAHTGVSVRRAFRDLLDRMDPPLSTLISSGDRVLLKPFLRQGGGDASTRMISHPEIITSAIAAIRDCGGVVTIGDEASKWRGDENHRANNQWLHDIAKSSGATLVSFSKAGATPIRSGLLFPRTYLISRALLDADKVVSCANFQPHGSLVLSGAVKNMFNAVVGKCQQHLHDLFPHPEALARIVVDVCATIKPTVSFLDLTTVRDSDETTKYHPVGLLLASTDPVALDAVAAQASGIGSAEAPTIRWGAQMGLGCSAANQMSVVGLDWPTMNKAQPNTTPYISVSPEGLFNRTSRFINTEVLRPGPVIVQDDCSGCGDCVTACPVEAISKGTDETFRINLRKCAHCHLCINACTSDAIEQQFGGMTKTIRRLLKKPLTLI